MARPTLAFSSASLSLLYFFSFWEKNVSGYKGKNNFLKNCMLKYPEKSVVDSGIFSSSAETGLQIWARMSHPSTAALACVTCIQDLLRVVGSPRALCHGPAVRGGLGAGTPTLSGPVGLNSPTQPCDGGQRLHPSALFPPVRPPLPPLSEALGPGACGHSFLRIVVEHCVRRAVVRHRNPGSQLCQPSVAVFLCAF